MKIKKFRNRGIADLFSCGIIMFAVIAVIVVCGTGKASEKYDEEEIQSSEERIRRAAVSCYAIEGRYPESFEYLSENYGVIINENKYAVHYEIFASNIMPEITLTKLGES